MLDGLAFLPLDEVNNGMHFLKANTPEGLEDLVQYFDSTYVSGSYRRIQPPPAQPDGPLPAIRVRRAPPLFPPTVWNVHEATITDNARTNNICESWNLAFQKLISHHNPSMWTAIDSIRRDQASVSTYIEQNANGEPPRKRVKKVTKDLHTRLRNICLDFSLGRKTAEELLRGVGRTIRWKTRD